MQLTEQILAAALKIRAEFNAQNPDMTIERIDLAGMMGEAIGLLCTFNDEGLKKITEEVNA
jgi:hypothetical protein